MLRFNQPVQSAAIGLHAAQDGWHEAELSGVWSRNRSATLSFPLDDNVFETGGTLVIEFIGAPDEKLGQWIEFRIQNLGYQRVAITDKSVHLLLFPFPPRHSPILTVSLESSTLSHVVGPKGRRSLGCLMKSVRVVPPRHESLSVPLGPISDGGVAYMRLPENHWGGLRLKMFRAGRILVCGEDDAIWTAVSQDGVFFIPASMTDAVRAVIFVGRDLGASNVSFAEPLNQADTVTSPEIIRDGGKGAFTEIRTSGDSFGIALLTFFPESTYEPVRVLIGRDGDEYFWRVRPVYGASWTRFAKAGTGGNDVRGEFRHERIGQDNAWSGRYDYLAAELVSNCLRASINSLRGELPPLEQRFIERLLRRVITLSDFQA